MNGLDFDLRFGGIQRLYGKKAFQVLQKAHICIVGLGGVGSWAVESLARTGLGELTLVDFDDICVSNTNRQIHASKDQIGKMKTQALKERLLQINPQLKVHEIQEAYSLDTDAKIFSSQYDGVIDAMDDLRNKFHLVLSCKQQGIPLVIAGAAGGRRDPSQIQVADLSKTKEDPMLATLRKNLRRKANFPRQGRFDLPSVFSTEKPRFMDSAGCMSTIKPDDFNKPLDCATGFGTVSHVTAVFGFMLSHLLIESLIKSCEN